MASKVPIIASNIGGIPEIIQNGFNGLLVNPQNSQELALAIIDLLSCPLKANKLVENAYLTSLEYSWKRKMIDVNNIYKISLNCDNIKNVEK